MSWSNDKELSSGASAISWNSLKKKSNLVVQIQNKSHKSKSGTIIASLGNYDSQKDVRHQYHQKQMREL